MTDECTAQTEFRSMTPRELALLIKLAREGRKWSQEQLAEISKVTVRTIQRVESGSSASNDTLRALARAFEVEDIDAFSKPIQIPTEEGIKAAQQEFARKNITLAVHPLKTGRQLADLCEIHGLDMCEQGFDMPREAQEVFATLVDYLHDYRDVASEYSEAAKLDVYDEMQAHIDTLLALKVSLRYAERKIVIKGAGEGTRPWPASVLYVITFPLGKEPTEIATPKEAAIKW